MAKANQKKTKQDRLPRTRSPNYPFLSLDEAVSKLPGLLESTKRHPVGVESAAKAMGVSFTSSAGKLALAAMRAYGLLDKTSVGMVKLSDRALDIAADCAPRSPAWNEAVKATFLAPEMHKILWERYRASLPGDDELRRYLVRERKFNDNSVGPFIGKYKKSLAFSGLAENGVTEKNGANNPDSQKPSVGDFVQWTSGGVEQFPTPLKVAGLSDDGEFAFVEGSQTGLPMAELSVVDPPAEQSNPKPPAPASKGPPPANPFYKPPVDLDSEEEKTNLEEGAVVLRWPKKLSQDSVEELDYWIQGVLRRARRKAGLDPEGDKPKSKPKPQ